MQELITFLQSRKEAGDDIDQICHNLLIITKKNYGKLRKFKFSQTNHRLHHGGDLEERMLVFKLDVIKYIDKYGKETCEAFYNHFSQPTHDLKKMKWELEKTWETGKRLAYWDAHDFRKRQ